MKKTLLWAACAVVLSWNCAVCAAADEKVEAAAKAKDVAAEKSSPDDDVRAAVALYASAFNLRDAEALAARWSAEGVHIDAQTGDRVSGRDAIEKDFAKLFAAKAEWMPLGTFAVATSEKEGEPTKVIQLAVDRQGIISGTFFNQQTDVTQAVQGQVDKETQRVAFRIGDNENVVVETGLYNLTQDETPVLVHYGADKTEYFLLVRLPEPEEGEQGASAEG